MYRGQNAGFFSQTEVVWGNFSPHIIRICLCVLRTQGFYINFRQLAINGHQCCVLAHASPLSVLKHALRRKCSLMATPSKRDSVNAQSSFKFRSVDSQSISFWLYEVVYTFLTTHVYTRDYASFCIFTFTLHFFTNVILCRSKSE